MTTSIKLTGHAYDWQIKDCYTETKHVELQAWCLDRQSQPFLMRIQDFPMTCYIELPSHIKQCLKRWGQRDIDTIYKYLNYCLGENAPVDYKFKYMEKLYYYKATVGNDGQYRPEMYPTIMLVFNNIRGMWACKKFLERPRDIRGIGVCNFKVWETNFKIHRKMLTILDLKYSQWFNVLAQPVDSDYRISNKPEYIVSYSNIEPIFEELTEDWGTQPMVFAYDIEQYSHNHNAFPTSYYALDVVYIITIVAQRYQRPDTRKRYAIVFGDCQPSERATVIKVKTELECIDVFQKLIQEIDPDIITGYNIAGYDNNTLHSRLQIRMQEWGYIGRIGSERADVKKTSWQSSGYGFRELHNFEIAGRINADIFQMIKCDYKFSTYDLNTISKHFLKRGKHDVDAKEMFRIYALSETARKIYRESLTEKYLQTVKTELQSELGWKCGKILAKCMLDARVIEDIYNRYHQQDHILPSDYPYSGIVQNFMCQQKSISTKDQDITAIAMSPFHEKLWQHFIELIGSAQNQDHIVEIYTAWLGTSLHYEAITEMSRVVEYGIEDAELVMDLFDKLSIWTALVETSNVCGVRIEDLYSRGQQIRGTSLVYNLAVRSGVIIDERVVEYIKMAGGYVGKPEPGLHDLVMCVDFSSLYPTIIMAYNICWSTLVPPELADIIPDHMCNVVEWTEDNPEADTKVKSKNKNKNKDELFNNEIDLDNDEVELNEFGEEIYKGAVRHFKYKFIKAEIRRGLLPTLIEEVVGKRTQVKKKMKHVTDAVIKGVLNSRQLALKVTANSCYGLISAQKCGKLSLVEGGMATTAVGRQAILKSNKCLEEKFQATIVYGDTDSTMFTLPDCKTGYECVTKGPEIADELTKLYPRPMKFEFEKAMRMLCICPKKYAAFLYAEHDIIAENHVYAKRDILALDDVYENGIKIMNAGECILKKGDLQYTKGQIIWHKGDLITDIDSIFVRGIILARRDNCQWQRNTYRQVLWLILMMRSMKECIDVMWQACYNLLTRQIPLTDLVLVRGLGSNYKSDGYFMKVFADELVKIGKPAQPGDRLEYVVVNPRIREGEWDGQSRLLLGHKMRLISTFLERQQSDQPENINVMYYIENLLKNSIEQIFYIAFKRHIDAHKSTQKKSKQKLYTKIEDQPIDTFAKTILERQKYINYLNSLVLTNRCALPNIEMISSPIFNTVC